MKASLAILALAATLLTGCAAPAETHTVSSTPVETVKPLEIKAADIELKLDTRESVKSIEAPAPVIPVLPVTPPAPPVSVPTYEVVEVPQAAPVAPIEIPAPVEPPLPTCEEGFLLAEDLSCVNEDFWNEEPVEETPLVPPHGEPNPLLPSPPAEEEELEEIIPEGGEAVYNY